MSSTATDHDLISTVGLLMEATNCLEKQLGASLEEQLGLPHSWFEVMVRISRGESGLAPMGSLAEHVALTGGGVTRLIDRMVAAGLVERVPCASDRRIVYAGLTSEGQAMLDKAMPIHRENLDQLLGDLSAQELNALDATLRHLRAARLPD